MIDAFYRALAPRAYFPGVRSLITEASVRRAVIVMGPRRVGKTVILHHVIQSLIDVNHVDPGRICFFSVDSPIYNGHALEELIALGRESSPSIGADLAGCYFFFDEIQYLRDWEQHLKSLVDSYPKAKFVASGSSAAALRLKSDESGAGRFTDFMLPPLTFHEYLMLTGETGLVRVEGHEVFAIDLPRLNEVFVEYLNYGGYPEVALSPAVRADAARYVRNDIIDKVLLRDLPSLYGIADIQELNSLFTTLAFNTAGEISLESLSQRAGIAKNTIKRYIEYLEAAFLVRRVTRIDDNARRFQRATHFKIYLTNPSLRAALFAPLDANDPEMGAIVETAVFAQWFHSTSSNLRYARWKDGEVDIVNLRADQRPMWAVECKWSDHHVDRLDEIAQLIVFCKRHKLEKALVTTRNASRKLARDGVTIVFKPASLYCYTLGHNIVKGA